MMPVMVASTGEGHNVFVWGRLESPDLPVVDICTHLAQYSDENPQGVVITLPDFACALCLSVPGSDLHANEFPVGTIVSLPGSPAQLEALMWGIVMGEQWLPKPSCKR